MILACVQPSYLAWIPLFKRMQEGDIFVYLDDVEYSKNSFHNRNFIKTSNGKELLTVPINYKNNSHKFISSMPINNDYPWQKKHWRSLQMSYQKSPYFADLKDLLFKEIYNCNWNTLGNLNITFIELLKEYLGISSKTYISSELKIESRGNQKLIDLCKNLGAKKFIVKPGTENYHPHDFFNDQGIELVFFEPKPKKYNQQYGDFIADLSAIDYAMNCGKGTPNW